jgi:hypothetical protein
MVETVLIQVMVKMLLGILGLKSMSLVVLLMDINKLVVGDIWLVKLFKKRLGKTSLA